MQNKSNHSMNIIWRYEYPTCYRAVTVGKNQNADVWGFFCLVQQFSTVLMWLYSGFSVALLFAVSPTG